MEVGTLPLFDRADMHLLCTGRCRGVPKGVMTSAPANTACHFLAFMANLLRMGDVDTAFRFWTKWILALKKLTTSCSSATALAVHRLQPWLNWIAEEKVFEIEMVEVKGRLPVIEWGAGKYEVLSYKSGCLAKLPREGEARFEELRTSSIITVFDLLRLPVMEAKPKKWSATNTSKITVDDPLRLPVIEEKPAANTLEESKVSAKGACGSTSGKHITDDMLTGYQDGGRYRTALIGY